MKQIRVELKKDVFLPGEKVEGRVFLSTDEPVKTRAIKVKIVGKEMTKIGSGKRRVSQTIHILEDEIILLKDVSDDKFELQPGSHGYDFNFRIPEKVPPSYKGWNVSIEYAVEARIDVPYWLDITDRKLLYVLNSSKSLDSLKKQVHFCSANFSDYSLDKPSFSAELSMSGFVTGQIIEGTVTLRNPSKSKLRKVDIALSAIENASAHGRKTTVPYSVSKVNVPARDIIELMPVRFNLKIPKNVSSSYEGAISNLRWAVEIKLDIPFGFDVRAQQPVEIVNENPIMR